MVGTLVEKKVVLLVAKTGGLSVDMRAVLRACLMAAWKVSLTAEWSVEKRVG